MTKCTLVFSIVLLLNMLSFSQTKMNIAVNDLTGKKIDQETAGIISDRLRSELINTGLYRVMERGEMANILKEQGFQQSGVCDDASCVVEVGQILGVERMVSGSVGKVSESLYTIDLKMIGVSTGEILYSVNEIYKGGIELLLSQGVTGVVVKLTEAASEEVQQLSFAGKTGDLFVESNIKGAKIQIDGESTGKVTPHTFADFPAGKHRLELFSDDASGDTIITLKPDDMMKVFLTMEQGSGSFRILTKPEGVEVFIRGEKKGTTPLKINSFPAGKHPLELRLNGYATHYQILDLGLNAKGDVKVQMEKAGSITVNSEPKGADLSVGPNIKGKTPFSSNTIATGNYELNVTMPGYISIREPVSIFLDSNAVFNFTLEHTQAWKDSIAAAGAKKKKAFKWARRITFGVGALGAGAMALLQERSAADNIAKAESIQAEYDAQTGSFSGTEFQTEYSNAMNAASDNQRMRNIFAGVGSGCAILFFISIPF